MRVQADMRPEQGTVQPSAVSVQQKRVKSQTWVWRLFCLRVWPFRPPWLSSREGWALPLVLPAGQAPSPGNRGHFPTSAPWVPPTLPWEIPLQRRPCPERDRKPASRPPGTRVQRCATEAPRPVARQGAERGCGAGAAAEGDLGRAAWPAWVSPNQPTSPSLRPNWGAASGRGGGAPALA